MNYTITIKKDFMNDEEARKFYESLVDALWTKAIPHSASLTKTNLIKVQNVPLPERFDNE